AKKLGRELYINNMEFNSVVLEVGKENAVCDVAAAALTVDDTRKQTLDFSDTYYKASQMVIVKEADTTFDSCKTAEDVEKVLKGFDKSKRAGVQSGTTGQDYCEDTEGFSFTTNPYKNASLAVQDLVNGNLDFVIVDEGPAKIIKKTMDKAG
ncbi:MAG: transporter substrate-binding domain-containing protein, partial [Clostridia bacterium]|nr:transporter substrate-binding domain-containing protein [Clostridia bacterium]